MKPTRKKDTTGIFDGLDDNDVDRTSALDRFYIPHSRAHLIQVRAERLMREARRNAGLAARAIMFTGVSGVGKSEALAVFKQKVTEAQLKIRGVDENDTVVNDDGMYKRKIIPVAYVNVPESASLKDFYMDFLAALGDGNDSGTVASMRIRIKKNVKNAECSIIIIDELQHLVDTENMRVKRNVANAIKRLLDVLHVPIVICGMVEAAGIFGPSLETKRRTDFCISITPYDFKDPKDRGDFVGFLRDYDEALVESGCFPKSSGLADEIRAQRIHFAARGCVSHVSRLIKAAGTFAIERGARQIEDCDFTRACDAIFMLEPPEIPLNPFRSSEIPAYHYRAGEVTGPGSSARGTAKPARAPRGGRPKGTPKKAPPRSKGKSTAA